MSFKIALIGCGNIGSRHLQALKKTQREIEITICEPFADSRATALTRYNEVEDNLCIKDFKVLENYKLLPSDIDFVIIATSASERFDIAKWVVNNIDLKYLLLEKVVFQSIDEFSSFDDLIKNKNIKVWVNCPRRMYGFYQTLKNDFSGIDKINMTVSGDNWGMGCNSIHMMDLYQYLTNCKEYKCDNSRLSEKIIDSRRSGYKELLGEIKINTEKGDITIVCTETGNAPINIRIQTLKGDINVSEVNKLAKFYDKQGNLINELEVDVIPQSCLTNIVTEDIIDTGDCPLTEYNTSKSLHCVMLESFLEHVNKFCEEEVKRCPIT